MKSAVATVIADDIHTRADAARAEIARLSAAIDAQEKAADTALAEANENPSVDTVTGELVERKKLEKARALLEQSTELLAPVLREEQVTIARARCDELASQCGAESVTAESDALVAVIESLHRTLRERSLALIDATRRANAARDEFNRLAPLAGLPLVQSHERLDRHLDSVRDRVCAKDRFDPTGSLFDINQTHADRFTVVLHVTEIIAGDMVSAGVK